MTDPTGRASALLHDAELVADVAVRLGRLQNVQLLSGINALKAEQDNSDKVAALQTSLNEAVKEIAPITLRDLRSGWNPAVSKPHSWPTLSFGIFAILLICVTAYMTLLYNRVSFAHASLVEIQAARVSEQVMKLYDLLRSNEKEMVEAVTSGKPRDVRLESFYKAYFDLKNTDEKLKAMIQESFALTAEGAVPARLAEMVAWIARQFSSSAALADAARERMDVEKKIKEREASYGNVLPQLAKVVSMSNAEGNRAEGASEAKEAKRDETKEAKKDETKEVKKDQFAEVIQLLFERAIGFTKIASLDSMNPLSPIPTYIAILRLHEIMNILGLWYLPALYGMLGSSVFHMRRFLDPNVPNPSTIRTAYRIFLGAFAGIVVVWFWAPSPQKGGEQVYSTLSSFSVAFLVGFSIDIFFQALDRLVTKVSQAIG